MTKLKLFLILITVLANLSFKSKLFDNKPEESFHMHEFRNRNNEIIGTWIKKNSEKSSKKILS